MEKVGMVTEKEKHEILLLYERKTALVELELTLDNPWLSESERNELSIKLEADRRRTSKSYDSWWYNMGEKYNWKTKEKNEWQINFETNEVFFKELES